ncbi:MAG: ATP-grasp domain-containing protein [Xanthomonadaceae bacterium]|nr:ATP-grasp domain-containing protein [Xanthomonadaceae bacterium]
MKKVLIANRGEIAIRIARTAKALGFKTVAVYSEADRFSEHAKYCDQAVFIGESEPKKSYLDAEKIIAAAKSTGAGFIHPGYGFLSERPHFVEACEKAGIIFVGPSADSMRRMGDKIEARKTVDGIGVPRVPGSVGALKNADETKKFAKQIGYPVLLKATAGGGGKGMRRVDKESEIESALDGASREALGAFGDGAMYLEKYILEPHHVEIQVFGDGEGGAIHCGERECSIQRRHQKVWEESPSPILNQYPKTREKMCEAAVKIASHIKYAGAGTFEFIVDGEGNFYFLEMNTRLQVEHPVTEWVTGIDLVSMQLKLANGEFKIGKAPETRGSSIEVRIYAEDPQTFLPAPGTLNTITAPGGAFIRWDSSMTPGSEISLFYDPMIAKLSTWGETREMAIARMRIALDEVRLEPPKTSKLAQTGSLRTNLTFLKKLVRNKDVLAGNTTTDLIAVNTDLTQDRSSDVTERDAISIALTQLLLDQSQSVEATTGKGVSESPWGLRSRNEGLRSW